MKIRKRYPRKVREIEHMTIPMTDGTLLAARMWIPEDAEKSPVPAILEYIPYRKRDLTAERDVQHHAYIAGFGYASVRVDLRGSGESEGIITDEYLQQELDDGVEVIQWLSRQKWCTGSVGMIGISWGGFNGLQIAALRPEPLRAIITICSTDDRYADDVHYMGGCLLGDNLSWASTMFDQNTHPPDPMLVGERWRDMRMERLEKSGFWLETWMRHQHRNHYWKHGSVCENYTYLDEDLEILGAPAVELELSSNEPVAMVAVRLSDVQPDDKATRITYGLLNLTHRNGHENPQPLEPGRRYRIILQLNGVAQRFPKGHRLRLSISTSYWPLAWPPPKPVQLTIYSGTSSLTLPVRPPRANDKKLRPFADPEGAEPLNTVLVRPREEEWRVIRDLKRDVSTLEVVLDTGTTRYEDIDLEISSRTVETYGYRADDYDSLSGETRWERQFSRVDWLVRTTSRTRLTSNETCFYLRADLDAYEGTSRVYSRSWYNVIPRRLV